MIITNIVFLKKYLLMKAIEKTKIGLLGGSFDPVHFGHLIIAQEAKERLALERILFIPAGQPWLKDRAIIPASHRLAMLRLALKGNPAFRLSKVEVDAPGPSYTAETLARLVKEMPGKRLFFLLGWDALQDLSRWREPERVLALAELVVFPRAGYLAPDISRLESLFPEIGNRLHLMEGPLIQISSTDIRRRVKEGLSIRYLVPRVVEEYIQEKGLYKEGG